MPTVKLIDGNTVQFIDSNGNVVAEQQYDDANGALEIVDGNNNPLPVSPGPIDTPSVSTENTRTETIGSGERLYAGQFDGGNPSTRLDNAISAASAGDTIYLENAEYTASVTVNKAISVIGTQPFPFSNLTGTIFLDASLTISSSWANVEYIGLVSDAGTASVEMIGPDTNAQNIQGNTNSEVNVNADRVRINDSRNINVTFSSGTTGGLADSLINASVTDNGTNTVGDIA